MSQLSTASLVATIAHPFGRTARAVVRPARTAVRWPVESQQRSRRNAMLAATDLTDRRRQNLLVEEFLAGYTARWEALHDGIPAPMAAEG
jgi:hypothetical protein